MGMLVNGKWVDQRPAEVAGRFVRPESQFRRFVTADGSSGFKAEPGRYPLYVSYPGSTRDAVNGFRFLHQAYTAAKPDYTGTVTVPALWDRKTRTIVNNESPEIIRMMNSAFDGVGPGDFYPVPLRKEIDRINEFVYAHINNGVYRTGFATTQEAYDEAVERVFFGLEPLEERPPPPRY